jgi:hypothetical protein
VKTADELVAEHFAIEDYVVGETKRFAEHLKPHRTRDEEIKNLLLAILNEQKATNIKTEHGTAYTSTIVTPKVVDRDAYLDLVMDNWDDFGNEMLQLGAPQKTAVEQYQQTHEGQLPPGVDLLMFTRVNIRRS